MRAIIKPRAAPGLEVGTVPRPGCGPHEVLIRVHHAGVCGTDLHIADWDEWAQSRLHPPLVIGHEFAGAVAEVGREVGDSFTVGQLVTAEGHIVCGHCRQCRTGNAHICQRTQIIGVDRDGAFADYIAMPAINVMPLDGIPTTVGAIMDPLGNAFHTVLSGDELAGEAVLILGCGPIGCFAVGVARAAGAIKVIASDVNPRRLELARRMGADVLINAATDDVVARTVAETQGEGADRVCEMSGHPTAIRQAFQAARLGGRVNLLGLPRGEVPIRLSTDVIFKGLTLYGVIGRRMYETWHQMRTFLGSGLLDPTPVVTHQFPLERIDDALEAIRSGAAGKVILEIGDGT
jgi:threonine 3-dehydrogenase